jgi:hypothetical protein
VTVPPTTNVPATPSFGVPPDFAAFKPNWIQDAEAIAKADINRLEGKIKTSCQSITILMIMIVASMMMAGIALVRSFR